MPIEAKSVVSRSRSRAIINAVVVALTMALMVGASLYKFIGGAVTSFSDESTDFSQQIAFCFALLMPLLSYGVLRKTNFWTSLAFQGAAVAVWIVLFASAFVAQGTALGLVCIVLVCAYMLSVAGFNFVFSFTVSLTIKIAYAVVAVVAVGGALTAYGLTASGAEATVAVVAGMFACVIAVLVASWLNRKIETETANAAVFGARFASVFYFWNGLLYFAIAVLAVPLTILVSRNTNLVNVPFANYIILGVSLVVTVALVVMARAKWMGTATYAGLATGNVMVATGATLLTGGYSIFLDAVDGLFILGVYLVVALAIIILFSPPVAVTRSFTVVRNMLAWYAAACLGTIVMIIATHQENALALAFMPLHTFIVFVFMLGLATHLGAVLVMQGARLRAKNASPTPLADPGARRSES